MKRATIEDLEVVDRLATHHILRDQGETIMMVAVKTRGGDTEEVNLHQLFAKAKLFTSRFAPGAAVVLLTAIEWRRLRGIAQERKRSSGPGREEEESSSDRKV